MAEDKLILYGYWRSSCSWRIRLSLALKGIPYEHRAVNLLKGEQKSAEYLAINPDGLVPTLVIEKGDERILLTQSIAILEYLEEAYPEKRRLLPKDLVQRARVREILMVMAADTQPLHNLRVLNEFEEPAKTTWGHKVLSRGFEAVERLMEKCSGKYSVGDEVTLADLAVVPHLGRFGVNTEDYPNIARITKTLEALPEFIAAAGPNQPDCPTKQ